MPGPETNGAPAPRGGELRHDVSYPLLLLTVCLGGVLAPVNSTMLAVALPELRREFDVGHGEIAWLVSAYLIAMAVAQPLGGRLGDQLGRVPVFRAGLIAFLALSIAAAAAPNYALLMAFRTGQALIGAMVIPNGIAMLRETLPTDRLGRSNGLIGSVISFSAAVGPMLGAALLALGSWRLLFLVNIPLVAGALLALAALHYPAAVRRRAASLDWRGAALFAVILALTTLTLATVDDGRPVLLVARLIALPVLLLVFVQLQAVAPNPIAEWRLFRIRSYAASTSYILLTNLVMYTVILAVPFFVEEVQGKGSFTTGTLLGAVSIPVAVLSPIGGRISDAIGRRPPVNVGAVLVIAGAIALLAGIAEDASFAYLLATLTCLGAGLGLSIGPSGAAAIESAPRDLAGAAAGTNSMMRYVGSIVGAGILGAVLNKESGAAPDIGLFRLIFAVLVVVSGAAFISSLFIHRFAGEHPHAQPADVTPVATPAVGGGTT